jgi:hypothetical protein
MSRRRIDGVCAGLFPAEAGPTREPRACSGIGGAAIVGPALAGKASDVTPQKSMVSALASSRLKPVPLPDHVQLAGPADHVHLVEVAEHAHLVGPALAGKASDVRPQNRWCLRWPLPGFSREGVGCHAAEIDGACAGLFPAEAGPTREPRACSGIGGAPVVGPALAGKASDVAPQNRW